MNPERTTRARRARRAVCFAAALLPLASCAAPEQVRYERAVDEASPAAVHALHEARLRDRMRDLQRLRTERLPTAMDVAGARALRVQEVEAVARDLSESARAIAAMAPTLALDATERAGFVGLAAALERAAAALAEASGTADGSLDARARAVEAICTACHERFRSFGVPSVR